MGEEVEKVLGGVEQSRRDFLRRVIAGAAFAPPLVASFSLDGLSLTTASGQSVVSNVCSNATVFSVTNATQPVLMFDFSDDQYQDNFRAILRGPDINPGLDLAGGGHPALNFTGSANAGGSTWLTVLDSDPLSPDEDSRFDLTLGLAVGADVLIHRFNNTKGIGLVAGFDEAPNAKGLALILWDAGNSDVLQLFTVDPTGKLTSLKSLGLGSAIAENAWYRLELDVVRSRNKGQFDITGTVLSHVPPGDPDRDVLTQIGQVKLSGPLPAGVDARDGEVGIIARAISAAVDSSVTNFFVQPCSPPADVGPIRF